MHKNTRLLPYQRREIYRRWCHGEKVTDLAKQFSVSRECLYRVFRKAKLGVFENFTSINKRYKKAYYGLRRLSKTETRIINAVLKRERRNNRYEKDYPGEMGHFDTKKLPTMYGEAKSEPREYLHVAIDDYSRFLIADILPDKTGFSSAIHLEETIKFMPFKIERAYSDNGSEYRGKETHPFVSTLKRHGIKQSFTKPRHPQTNGKAERVIKTIMTECFYGRTFKNRDKRREYLYAYVNYYNQVRPHQSLNGKSPLERLEAYLNRAKELKKSVNNA
jgi:transposase InsO family protein